VTHYDTLGVPPTATAKQIAAAYKRKARLVHPDRHHGADARVMAEAERAMRAVNEAWEVLGDPVHRRVYDESLRPARPTPPATAPPASAPPATAPRPGGPVRAAPHRPGPARTAPPAPPAPRRVVPAPAPARRGWYVAAGCAAIALVWAVAAGAGDDRGGPPPSSVATGQTAGTALAPRGSSIVFHDDQVGFTITYPRTWRELTPTAADMRLALEFSDRDGLELRVASIGGVANEQTITSFKSLTDSLVYTDASVRLRRHQLVTLNGRPTYYYVTTYVNGATGAEGVHEQYFIFEGRRMFSLRFQSEPAREYEGHASVYAAVADSFTVTRG